jgi:hypothetical protein
MRTSITGSSNQDEKHGWGMLHAHERRDMPVGLRWEKLNEREKLQDLGVEGRIILICFSKKQDGCVWTEKIGGRL